MPKFIETQTLRDAIARAVEVLRARVADPFARVAFVVPSRVNAEQVRRLLGEAGPFIHVDFMTPDSLVSALGTLALLQAGRRPEPAGWLGAWLVQQLPDRIQDGALEPHGQTLIQPGWQGPIQNALRELQAARVDAAMLETMTGDDPVAERLTLIGQIMAWVEESRAEQGYFSRSELEDSALAGVEGDAPLPCQAVCGVIVLGDGLLSRGTFAVLQAWLARREVLRVSLPPFDHLDPAPGGIREAAGESDVVTVLPGAGRLGHLKSHLFKDDVSPAFCGVEQGTSVRCVTTPDDMREMNEVARTVQAAIQQGTALDRIAVVLPQTSGAEALAAALRRASIPATWLTGAPLIGDPCARFLWLALSLAPGGAVSAVAASWYDLLAQPGLMGLPRSGRGRWRRLLSECPQGLSVPQMAEHFLAVAAQARQDSNEREEVAATVLADAVTRVQRDLEALPATGSLHEHAASWRRFMERWWRPGPERDRVLQAVDGWGGGDRELPLPRSTAAQLLVEELRQVQKRSGSLTQPKIRIMPPMGLLGGTFDLVCVTGLSDGCFPRQPRETALLTDAMVLRLQAHGAPVLTTAETHEVERRRFGAVVAACEGTLWLSTPRSELLEGTPQLPGALLMAALSCLAGRRVLFRDLPTLLMSQGSRARPLAQDPDAALGVGEFLVARAAWTPAAALGPLAANPTTHRLLSFHRAVDRLRHGADSVPNAWTGAVPLTLLSPEAIQQEALSPEALARLVLDPAGYFWRDVLGVWRARSLRRPRLNMTQSGITRQVLQLVLEAFSEPGDDPEARFEQLWEAQLQTAARQLGVQDAAQINTWRILGRRAHAELVQSHHAVLAGTVTASPAAPVVADVPLLVAAEPTPLHNGKLVIPSPQPPGTIKVSQARGFEAMTQGYAARAAGQLVDVVRLLAGDGQFRDGSLAKSEAEYQARVQQAWQRTQAGWWPISSPSDPLALTAEREAAGRLLPELAAAIVDSMRVS